MLERYLFRYAIQCFVISMANIPPADALSDGLKKGTPIFDVQIVQIGMKAQEEKEDEQAQVRWIRRFTASTDLLTRMRPDIRREERCSEQSVVDWASRRILS